MDHAPCQALCAYGCEVSEQLGALLALVAWALLTTVLALWERYRLGRERVETSAARAAASAAESAAAEAAAKADYWQAQSMRAPAMPREALELVQAFARSVQPAANAQGTRWVDPSARPPAEAESDELTDGADGGEPTDSGKRRPPSSK